MSTKQSKEKTENIFDIFWKWFSVNSDKYFNYVKNNENIQENFFPELDKNLNQIKEGFFYSVGMLDSNTAELILTADGNISNIVFIEELVNTAPNINGWKFTSLKQPSENADFTIKINDYIFSSDNMYFYVNEDHYFPDEIDITIVHKDMNEKNVGHLKPGIFIYLENFIGELTFANAIDSLRLEGLKDDRQNLIPIEKLKDYLIWREKEFIEKYEGTWYDIEFDSYSLFEAELEDESLSIALINTDLLAWDRKASHPWIAILTIGYEEIEPNGMPNDEDIEMLEIIEDMLLDKLIAKEGNVYLGRETVSYEREIFFVCKDFREVSKIFHLIQTIHGIYFDVSFDIYKDKYWQSFERFM